MVSKLALNNAPKLIKMVTQKKKKKPRAKTAGFDSYTTMIADPCNATLVPGMYGSNAGMLARFKSSFAFSEYSSAWGAYTYGYVLWFPTYHNPTTVSGSANLFFFASSSPSTAPTLLNYGVFGNTTSAQSGTDPTYNFVHGDLCQDARTLSACIQSPYIGTTSAAKGLYIPITNMPLSAVLIGGSSGSPPTVDQMRNYATMQERAATTDEVVWRPAVSTPFLSSNFEGITVSNGSNSLISQGTSAVTATGIAIVFYGVSALSDYALTCYKNIEWRSEPASGLTSQPVIGADNPARISSSLAKLDRKKPFWQTKAAKTAGSIITEVALAGIMM
jgi:hypothetical protein